MFGRRPGVPTTELNVRVPLIARNLLSSIALLTAAASVLALRHGWWCSDVERKESAPVFHVCSATVSSLRNFGPHRGINDAQDVCSAVGRVFSQSIRGRAQRPSRGRRRPG